MWACPFHNEIYVSVCRTAQIYKSCHFLTNNHTAALQNESNEWCHLPICFWLSEVFIPKRWVAVTCLLYIHILQVPWAICCVFIYEVWRCFLTVSKENKIQKQKISGVVWESVWFIQLCLLHCMKVNINKYISLKRDEKRQHISHALRTTNLTTNSHYKIQWEFF